jgi:shikimate dehydrogenase/3-dehydroquinate dehydratase type I
MMTKICVPISGSSADVARRMANEAISSGADLVEIRADLIAGADPATIKKRFSDILGVSIITLRSKAEGGKSELTGVAREKWLLEALDLGAAFTDLEHDADRRLLQNLGNWRTRVIASKHFLGGWKVEEIGRTLAECCSFGGIGKVAASIRNPTEGISLLDARKSAGNSKFSLMGMGEGAEITRALAGSIGSELAFCALEKAKSVSKGQLTLEEQKRILPDDRIVVGLIGHPLGHTLSPRMHNAAFRETKLPGIYLTFDVPDAGQVKGFMRGSAKLGARGFNVTIPYKEVAFSAMDFLDDEARRAKAVNTVLVQEDKTLKGFNTDIFGFSESLRAAGYDPRNKRALIVGAGGASRAAVIALWKMGAKIIIANRTPERAEELVKSMRVFVKTVPLGAVEQEKPFSLIVNATPVGMRGFETAPVVPESLIGKAEAVLDMVYNPIETPLLEAAKPHGVKMIHGLDMLLFQGAKAFEIWTSSKAPVDIMKHQLVEAIG